MDSAAADANPAASAVPAGARVGSCVVPFGTLPPRQHMLRSPPVRTFLLMSLGLASACADPTEPNTRRVIGRIDPSLSSRPVVDAPREVRAGEEFRITVTTIGVSCTTAEGGDVRVVAHLARVIPYDREPRPGHEFCGERTITLLPRELRLTLVRAGTAQLRVVGLKAATREAELDSLDIALTVLP